MPTKKYYKITPLLRLPASINQEFTYVSREVLEAGDLVLVEFRRRQTPGLVTGKADEMEQDKEKKTQPALKIKPVLKIIEKKYLSQWQLDLWREAADHYWSGLAFFLKTAVPKRVIAREPAREIGAGRGAFAISREETQLARKIIEQSREKKTLLLFGADRSAIYYYLISRALNQKKQALLLAPDLFLAHAYYLRLCEIFGAARVALLTKNRSGGEYFREWEAFRKGRKSILVGTRSAALAAPRDPGLVIVDEAQDPSHKQWEMNPRYNARWMAEKIPDYCDLPVVLGTNTPNVEDYFGSVKEKAVIQKLKPNLARKKARTTQDLINRGIIVDANERHNFSQSPVLADSIIQAMEETLKKQQTVFVGTSQKGSSGGYFCRDCGYIPRCANCDSNYYLTGETTLKCPVCGAKKNLPKHCPDCKNPVIKVIGIGVERLRSEIGKVLAGHQVLLVDDEKQSRQRQQTEQIALTLKQGIVIGSLACLRLARFNPATGGIFLINPDKSVFLPDFNARERRFQEIGQLVSDRYQLRVQTKYPKQRILRYALLGRWDQFYQRELKARKAASLPPFSRLIKFTARDASEERARQKLERLKLLLEKGGLKLIFGGDIYPGYPEKVRKKMVLHLTIGMAKGVDLNKVKRQQIIEFCAEQGVVMDIDPKGLV